MTKSKAALEYHEYPRPGKIEVNSTKACSTAYEIIAGLYPGRGGAEFGY